MLDGNTTDTIEGSSLSYRNNYIHIYSCAWGPKDDGKRFGRPGTLASKALLLGTKEVRKEYISTFSLNVDIHYCNIEVNMLMFSLFLIVNTVL